MKFTILIAAYNASRYLNQCLDSIFSQTEKSVQVIVIDDCSTDDSEQIERQYTKVRDNCVLVLHTPQNSGQAEARNLGLQYAVGELTMMVDADDWLAPDCLERMWEAYTQAEDIDAVVNRVVMTEKGREWDFVPFFPVELPQIMTGREACLFSLDWRLHGYYAVRTSIHREIPYDARQRIYSDDNTCRYHYLASRRVALSEGIYYYRQHAESCTHSSAKQINRLMFLRANMNLRAWVESQHLGPEALFYCERHCWPVYEGIYREMYHLRRDVELNDDQIEEIEETLREAYDALRLDRLGKRKMPYRLFRLYEHLVIQTKKFLGH